MENIYQYTTDGQGPSASYSSVPQNGSEMAAMTLSTADQAGTSNAGYQPIRLKPCEVCFDKATGYHFGVISCEACKSFFRRSLKRKGEYLCEKGGGCQAYTRGNNSCAACRLARCYQVGMSPDAVKKGRYSLAKRAETINKSKDFWQKLASGSNEAFEPTSASPAPQKVLQITPKQEYQQARVTQPRPKKPKIQTSALKAQLATPPAVSLATLATPLQQHSNDGLFNVGQPGVPAPIPPIPGLPPELHPHFTKVGFNQWGVQVSGVDPTQAGGTLGMVNPPVVSQESLTEEEEMEEEEEEEEEPFIPNESASETVVDIPEEICIDGKPVSLLLGSIFQKPKEPEELKANETNGQSDDASHDSIAHEMVINGVPVASLFGNIVARHADKINEKEKSNEEKANVMPFTIDGFSANDLLKTLFKHPRPKRVVKKPAAVKPEAVVSVVPQLPPALQAGLVPGAPLVFPGNLSASQASQMAGDFLKQFVSLHTAQANLKQAQAKQAQAKVEPTEADDLQETAETLINLATMPRDNNSPRIIQEPSISERKETAPRHVTFDLERTLMQCTAPPGDTQEEIDLENMVQETFDAVEKTKFLSNDFVAEIPNIQARFLESRDGPPDANTVQTLMKIKKEQDSKNELLQNSAKKADIVVQKFIDLYKSFPGYTDLNVDDQIAVLKGSKTAVGYLMNNKIVNVKEQLVTSPFLDVTYDINYFRSFASDEAIMKTFELAEKAQRLQLNDLEVAVAAPIYAMQPDLCVTVEGRAMCELQRLKSIKALYRVLCEERPHEEAVQLIRDVFNLLRLIMAQEDSVFNQLDKLFKEYDHSKYPKVITEVYGTSSSF